MTISWFGAGALLILLICIAVGYKRGFIKEAISAGFVLLSLALVYYLNPYVNGFLRDNTPIYERIQESCEETLTEKLEELNGNLEDAEKSLLDSMNLPEFLKKQIINEDKNGPVLNLQDSIESLSASLAEMLVNGISFVITYLMVIIALKLLASLLNMLATLPIIKGINHTAGAVLGAAKGFILVWIILLVLTLICNTELGQECLKMMEDDVVIKALNAFNPLMTLFMNIK